MDVYIDRQEAAIWVRTEDNRILKLRDRYVPSLYILPSSKDEAERIVSRLTSIHNPKEPEGHIIAEDSRIEGLKINGEDVKVILRHDLLVKCKTFSDLVKGIAGDKKSGKIVALDEDRKVAICSLVEKIETRLKGVDAKRHLIEVKDFGKIFLAEVLAYPGTKTLTMLRLENQPAAGRGHS